MIPVSFPGFVDLQVNGFAGVDFNTPGLSPDGVRAAGARLRETGVTRFLPTLITSSLADFAACASALLAGEERGIAGVHLEGPYLSPLDGPRGAHPQAQIQPASIEDFCRRQDMAGGRIVLVTLAPEVPGALGLIEYLSTHGVKVALGHSAADAFQVGEAIRAGATLSTHLGNGCALTLDRHANVLWPQLAADELRASFIADGHHLPAPALKSFLRAKGLARSLLVTDATAAAGAPAGTYRLGGLAIERSPEGRVAQPGTPYLAGSALTMDQAVAHTAKIGGWSLAQVIPLATTQPAAYLGIATAGTVTAEWDPDSFRLVVRAVTGD